MLHQFQTNLNGTLRGLLWWLLIGDLKIDELTSVDFCVQKLLLFLFI